MDVVEIDAASNRGIDEIRDLREKIWLAPLRASRKVYIIDEVHMLTTEAFNALLKTLEEPPGHAMFILCTTEFQKVPATILSRCFVIQFHPATDEELARSFRRIVKGEGIDITDEALAYIAGLSDGGFRDGVKVLEEMSLVANGRQITKELVEEKYQVSSIKLQVSSMLEGLVQRDAKKCLEIVEDLVGRGTDVRYFMQELMEALHEELLRQTGVKNLEFPAIRRTGRIPGNPADRQNSRQSGGQAEFGIREIKLLYELFSKAYSEMRFSVLAQLPLELAVLEYVEIMINDKWQMANGEEDSTAKGEEQRPKSRGSGEQGGSNVSLQNDKGGDDGSVTLSKLRRQVNNNLKMQAVNGVKDNENVVVSKTKTVVKSDVELLQVPASGVVSAEWLEVLWKNIILEMKQYNHTIAGVLRSCSIRSYDNLPAGRQGKLLVISAGFPFHKERLDDMKARQELKRVCKLLTGNDVEIEVELGK
jgi:DNA polymerase III subunit gamma/tau